MIFQMTTSIATIIIAIVVHEFAHGLVAYLLGDNTAKEHKRLSINPLNHIDLFGSLILPILMFLSKSGIIFGWAKPVPIDYNKLKNKKINLFLVASAGVIANFILAIISAFFLKLSLLIPQNLLSGILATFFLNMIFFNTLLAVFNLLPIPPLDGSKILFGWSNNNYIKKYLEAERLGILLIIFVLFIIPIIIKYAGYSLNPIAIFIQQITKNIVTILI